FKRHRKKRMTRQGGGKIEEAARGSLSRSTPELRHGSVALGSPIPIPRAAPRRANVTKIWNDDCRVLSRTGAVRIQVGIVAFFAGLTISFAPRWPDDFEGSNSGAGPGVILAGLFGTPKTDRRTSGVEPSSHQQGALPAVELAQPVGTTEDLRSPQLLKDSGTTPSTAFAGGARAMSPPALGGAEEFSGGAACRPSD